MEPSIRVYTKTKRPDQAGQMVGVRLQPVQLERLDAWISEQAEPITRPEAVRRLLDKALS